MNLLRCWTRKVKEWIHSNIWTAWCVKLQSLLRALQLLGQESESGLLHFKWQETWAVLTVRDHQTFLGWWHIYLCQCFLSVTPVDAHSSGLAAGCLYQLWPRRQGWPRGDSADLKNPPQDEAPDITLSHMHQVMIITWKLKVHFKNKPLRYHTVLGYIPIYCHLSGAETTANPHFWFSVSHKCLI